MTRFQPDAASQDIVDEMEEWAIPTESDDRAVPGANIPDHFWEARPLLTAIRDHARSRMVGPDTVFHAFLAAYSSQLNAKHTFCIDTGLASPVAFTYLVATAGPSGSSKSAGYRVGCALAGDPHYFSPSSGEGLVEHFMGKINGPDDKPVRAQTETTALVFIDEGSTIEQLAGRAGSTIAAVITSAATGGTLSTQSANSETTRHVQGGSYSMGLVINLQVRTSAHLLAQTDSGFKQRFIWVSPQDASAPKVTPVGPSLAAVQALFDWPSDGPFTVGVTDEIRAELSADLYKRLKGDLTTDIDSQRPVAMLKLGGLLALLDGRRTISNDDWTLATTLYETSQAHVEQLMQMQSRLLREEVLERGAEKAVEARGRKLIESGKVRERTHNRIVKLLSDGPKNRAALTSKMSESQRGYFDSVIAEMVDKGQLRNIPDVGFSMDMS